MKRKFNKLARLFSEQGYNVSVTDADGVITLSVWCRNHKPGDIATDVFFTKDTGAISLQNGLQLPIEL